MLFDTHAHLDADKFSKDRPKVIQRAFDSGVTQVLAVGICLPSTVKAIELARDYPGRIYAAAGIHPNNSAQIPSGSWDQIKRLSHDPQVVAIGETGLDRYWDYAPMPVQIDNFNRHLELSRDLGKPIVIHCREADQDVVSVLNAFGKVKGILHSFASDLEMAERGLELGLHVSFAGQITFKNKKFDLLRSVVPHIPLDRLLVETDSPYLSPEPKRGKRNEPSHVRHTATKIAEILQMEPEELFRITTENAQRLFNLAAA